MMQPILDELAPARRPDGPAECPKFHDEDSAKAALIAAFKAAAKRDVTVGGEPPTDAPNVHHASPSFSSLAGTLNIAIVTPRGIRRERHDISPPRRAVSHEGMRTRVMQQAATLSGVGGAGDQPRAAVESTLADNPRLGPSSML